MIRLSAMLLALTLLGCSHWEAVQMKRVEQDWGVHKPHKPWIYQP